MTKTRFRKRVKSMKRKAKGANGKRRTHRSQKGGQCYGRGVGANTYDPNYSIYNTNMLKLFPYRT